MSSTIPSQNPFIVGPIPPKDETPEERSEREREEARAKAVSDAIDEQIERDRVAFQRYKRATKVLLLGQSESGKTTIIKNFQRTYAYDSWVRERSLWTTVIRLNLIRSVTAILERMDKAMKVQNYRPQSRQRSFSPSLSIDAREPPDGTTRDPIFNFSEKHRLLQLRLRPLTYVQKVLEEYLGLAFEVDQAGTAFQTTFPTPGPESFRGPRRHAEFSTSDNGSRKARFFQEESTRPSGKKTVQDLDKILSVLYCSGSDIKELWADDVVQQVVKGAEHPLEHSGFSMDDIDRFLKRNCEPSDEDVVKARSRTVGVQEYHLSIPTYKPCEDWIFYDVGGSRTLRHAWCSYFDDITSIVLLAPLSCFDQRLEEDPRVNRLEDSLLIWKHVCNSKLLEKIQLILFLSKVDLLKEKLESGVRFGEYLISYGNHPNDVSSVTSYLKQKFKAILKNAGSQRTFNCYLTSATDVEAASKMLLLVREGILRAALENLEPV